LPGFLRVLHLDSGREMRGGQWQVRYLLEGLGRAGHESILLTRPLGLGALIRQRGRFDIVHAHDARSHTLAVCARLKPLVVSRRVAFPIKQGVLSRWKYSRPRHYIAVSKYVEQMLVRAGVPREKISVVYDGVPLGEPARPGSRVVAPATDDPRKGTALLKQAAALANVEVHFSSNVAEDLRDAGLFVYITHEEGLGSAVLLAMAAGVPVIASHVGGLPEVVEDGETGLLTENTPEQIASRISRLLNDRALALALAERARKQVEERFSVDIMVRETVKVYEKVVGC
jgi:glycosyltransferase involved in cell wall biosynthesis